MYEFYLVVSLILFVLATGATFIYSLHLLILLALFWRKQKTVRAKQRAIIDAFATANDRTRWPAVTTQLPIYNESQVVERLIDAVVAMDYPTDLHEIQILDDSTDATRERVDIIVDRHQRKGVNIKAVRRSDRKGYKAGALAHATPQANGRYLAIFDADFVPPRDFLIKSVALLEHDPQLACLQGRWTHLNRDESWLTRAQALGIDGHFAIEQGARAWNGLLMNFNGTAGVWRRSAIEDPQVGGWSADTLTEDLDLSYRAQLAGWRIDYCVDLPCPAEVPSTPEAFKSQQRRWATGSIQVARKLLPRIWRSPLSICHKLEATLHLTHYSIAVFMLVLAVIARPMILLWLREDFFRPWFVGVWAVVCVMAFIPSLVYTYARFFFTGRWNGIREIPGMMVMGVGICLNNAIAVIRGLYLRGGEFVRTPKSGSTAQQKTVSRYRAVQDNLWLFELALGVFSAWTWVVYLSLNCRVYSIFILIYALGFLAMGWASRPWRAVGPLDAEPSPKARSAPRTATTHHTAAAAPVLESSHS